jgi:regulatory protein
MMISIEQINKHKMRVSLDGEPAFIFTDKDMADWGISDGMELDAKKASELIQYGNRMAARAAMDMLVRRDYSETELLRKLMDKGFSKRFAAAGVDYVNRFHYLDDERYARQFISGRIGTASGQMMTYKLKQKGISDEIIQKVLEESEWDDKDGIALEIRKRYGSDAKLDLLTDRERQKLCQSLMRKGYRSSDISSYLRNYCRFLGL